MLEFYESDEDERPTRGGQVFFPALSIQRYDKVLEELLRHEDVIDKVSLNKIVQIILIINFPNCVLKLLSYTCMFSW